ELFNLRRRLIAELLHLTVKHPPGFACVRLNRLHAKRSELSALAIGIDDVIEEALRQLRSAIVKGSKEALADGTLNVQIVRATEYFDGAIDNRFRFFVYGGGRRGLGLRDAQTRQQN